METITIRCRKVLEHDNYVLMKMPRLETIDGLEKELYRALQAGKVVDVSEAVGTDLIERGFCEACEKVEE